MKLKEIAPWAFYAEYGIFNDGYWTSPAHSEMMAARIRRLILAEAAAALDMHKSSLLASDTTPIHASKPSRSAVQLEEL
jgi:hypothetical protein